MDPESIVKKMLKEGKPEEEIAEMLSEVGVANPSEIIEKTKREMEEEAKEIEEKPTIQKEEGTAKPAEEGGEGKMAEPVEEKAEKPEEVTAKPTAEKEAEKQKEVAENPEEELVEEIKKPAVEKVEKVEKPKKEEKERITPTELEITQISEGGEKKTTVGEMLEKEIEKGKGETSQKIAGGELEDLKAQIKALQELNKKILQVNRDILLKLQK